MVSRNSKKIVIVQDLWCHQNMEAKMAVPENGQNSGIKEQLFSLNQMLPSFKTFEK